MVTSCLQWSIQEPIIFPSGPTAEPKHTKSCTISFYSFLYYRINSSLTLMVLCKCWIMFLRLQRHLLLQLFWLWPKISHYRINLFFRLFCLKMRHKYVDPQPGPRSQRAAELPSWCRPPHYLSNGFKSAATGEHKPLLLCFYVIRILSCFYCLILQAGILSLT